MRRSHVTAEFGAALAVALGANQETRFGRVDA
jgi:hypothetical protein